MCTSRCCPGQLTPSHCGVTGNPATKQAQIFKGNLSWLKYPLYGSSCIVFCCCFMVFFLTGLIGKVFTWDLVFKAPTILWPLWWMCSPHLMGFFSSHYDFNPVITLSRAKWVLCTVLNKTGKASHQGLGYVYSKNKNKNKWSCPSFYLQKVLDWSYPLNRCFLGEICYLYLAKTIQEKRREG